MEKVITILFMVMFFAGCAGDPYEDYIGLWELQDANDHEIMEITRDGETILFTDNIFRNTDFRGNPNRPMTLSKSEGSLSYQMIVFGLGEDRKTLHVSGMIYKKIDLKRLEEVKTIIAKENADREQQIAERERRKAIEEEERARKRAEDERNLEKCKALASEYDSKIIPFVKIHSGEIDVCNKERERLSKIYVDKSKSIPNCHLTFY